MHYANDVLLSAKDTTRLSSGRFPDLGEYVELAFPSLSADTIPADQLDSGLMSTTLHSQWRDRAGFTPASLLTLGTNITHPGISTHTAPLLYNNIHGSIPVMLPQGPEVSRLFNIE